MKTSFPNSLNVSLINFGGKNDSPFEFYNSSDTESASFFRKTNELYNLFSSDDRFVFDIMKQYFDYNELTIMLSSVNTWFIQNINIELLSMLSEIDFSSHSLSSFDISNCKLSNVFTYILTKDKGVGGFEQINSSRPSNCIKHYKKLINSKRFLETENFRVSLFETYNQINGSYVSPIDGKDSAIYSDYFLKGRKEGPNNTKKIITKIILFILELIIKILRM